MSSHSTAQRRHCCVCASDCVCVCVCVSVCRARARGPPTVPFSSFSLDRSSTKKHFRRPPRPDSTHSCDRAVFMIFADARRTPSAGNDHCDERRRSTLPSRGRLFCKWPSTSRVPLTRPVVPFSHARRPPLAPHHFSSPSGHY